MKPIIGITVDCRHEPHNGRSRGKLELNWNYAECVAVAGGVPLLIPPQADVEAIAGLIDGWLIPGGNDIDGKHFGQETHPKASLGDPARFEAESALFRTLPSDAPVLGICYGCQFLNIAYGGDLVQHLPDVVGHENHSGGTPGRYTLEPDSKLASLAGEGQMIGLSFHHQACGRPGEGLRVVGRDDDGVIEALEAVDRPWLIGVQWHPERTPDDPGTQRLIAGFVAAAAAYRALRHGKAVAS